VVDEYGIKEELTLYSVRVFLLRNGGKWCYQGGFQKVSGYGNWQKAPLTASSEEMIVVAEKD
jgi:hypothetical protein